MADGYLQGPRTADPRQQVTGQLGQRNNTYRPVQQTVEAEQVRESFGSQALRGLADLGQKIGLMGLQNAYDDAYVAGERQRLVGKVEEELQSSWLTRPFTRGGWRDQNYMADIGKHHSDTQAWIKATGHTLDPESFATQMQQRTNAFLEEAKVHGASPRVRAKTMAMLTQTNDQLAQEYTKEHQNYSTWRNSTNLNTYLQSQMATLASNLDYLQGAADATPQVEGISQMLLYGLESTPAMLRAEVQKNALTALYEAGHIHVADSVYDNIVHSGALQDMPLDVAQDIGTTKRAARQKAGLEYKMDAFELLHEIQVKRDQGIPLNSEDYRKWMQTFSKAGLDDDYSIKEWEALFRYTPKVTSADKRVSFAEAYASGDTALLARLGGDQYAGANQHFSVKLETSGSYPEAVQAQLEAGIKHDWGTFGTDFGKAIDRAYKGVAQSMERGEQPREDDMQTLQTVMATLAKVDDTKLANLRASILAGNDPATQSMLMHMLKNPNQDVYSVINQSSAIAAEHAKQESNAVTRTMQDRKHQKEANDWAEDNYSQWWAKLKGTLGIFTPGVAAEQEVFSQFKFQLASKYDEVRDRPGMRFAATDDVMRLAAAEVEQDYVSWHAKNNRNATMFVTKDLQAQFKGVLDVNGKPIITAEIGKADIAQAMMELYDNPTAGTAMLFETKADGQVYPIAYDKDNPAKRWESSTPVDMQQVAHQIKRNHDADIAKRTGAYHPAGSAMKVKDIYGSLGTVEVGVHGRNTMGLDPELVQQHRAEEMRDFEGFSTKKYPDAGGEAIGFGRNITKNPLPKRLDNLIKLYNAQQNSKGIKGIDGQPIVTAGVGTVSKDDVVQGLVDLYMEDSDKSIVAATQIAREYGFEDDTATVLAVSAMVYQLGEGDISSGTRSFRDSLQLIAEAKDWNALVENSKTWKWTGQTPKRVEAFLRRVKPRFDNNATLRRPSTTKHIGSID